MKISCLLPVALVCTAVAAVSSHARADSFGEKCPDIADCAKVVGQLLGQKYLFDLDVKGKIVATPNLELTKDNAEILFTDMLNLNGFSRVPAGVPGTYQIMRQRDARDAAIPTVSADQNTAPELPNNWDLITLKYRATHADAIEMIARMSRSFMPANSRIIPNELSGMVLVTDSSMNLRKLYDLIKDMDRKPSAELKKRWAEMEKERAKHGPPPAQVVQPKPGERHS
jgi:type II secretory pathway component GspD/PulD (secretin)